MEPKLNYFQTLKYVIALLMIAVVFSCGQDGSDLQGTWIGGRVVQDGETRIGLMTTPLVNILGDSIECKIVSDRKEATLLEYRHTLEFGEKKLFIEDTDSEFDYHFMGNDSVSVQNSAISDKEMIFYRLNKAETLQKRVLFGEKFEFVGNKGDKVEMNFLNDSICEESVANRKNVKKMTWEIIDLKSHSFLVLRDAIGPIVLHVDSIKNDGEEILLSVYPGPKLFNYRRID